MFCNGHDAPELAAVHAQCFANDKAWSTNFFYQQLKNPAVIGLAEHDGKGIVSFGLFQLAGGTGDVLTFATRPDRQGQGLGKKILAGFIGLVPAKIKLWLEVAPDNAAAIHLYKKMGFGEQTTRANYYGTGQAAMLLMFEKL